MSMADLIANASTDVVSVRSPQAAQLRTALARADVTVTSKDPDRLEVTGLPAAEIGRVAHDLGVVLHELSPRQASLEQAFMDMTRDEVEFHAVIQPTSTTRSAA